MSYLELINKACPKIICVGKNYLKHVKEMGGSNIPQAPVLFLKPWSSLNYQPKLLSLPYAASHRISHQLELGVFISKGGSKISKESAMDHVGGYFLALDFTDRNLQEQAKKKGFPWSLSKGQDNFCPVTNMIDKEVDPYKIQLELKVNGDVRQKEFASEMHFKIDEIISYTSNFMSFSEGDLILTGTPDGVGDVKFGDKLEGKAIYGEKVLAEFNFEVVQ